MIARSHLANGTASEALYSPCGRYRYALTRVWDAAAARVAFVMLNPSTATEARNDPTIERCVRRARALGFGAVRAVNIFAWRETAPAALRRAPAPVGAENDSALLAACDWADMAICAWGVHGAHLNRGAEVERLLRRAGHALHRLGVTMAGHPRHPLYIGYAAQPEPWRRKDGAA